MRQGAKAQSLRCWSGNFRARPAGLSIGSRGMKAIQLHYSDWVHPLSLESVLEMSLGEKIVDSSGGRLRHLDLSLQLELQWVTC